MVDLTEVRCSACGFCHDPDEECVKSTEDVSWGLDVAQIGNDDESVFLGMGAQVDATAPQTQYMTVCSHSTPMNPTPGQTWKCPSCGKKLVAKEKVVWEEKAVEAFPIVGTSDPQVSLSPGDGE